MPGPASRASAAPAPRSVRKRPSTLRPAKPRSYPTGLQVTYVIDDSASASAGTVSGSGAVPVGVGAGASRSSSKLKTGTITFKSQARPASSRSIPGKYVVAPTLPPNTVAGALDIAYRPIAVAWESRPPTR